MASENERIDIREVLAVLQQMDAKLPEESTVVLRLVDPTTGDVDDTSLVPVAVGALQGIGEPSQLIIYVERTDG